MTRRLQLVALACAAAAPIAAGAQPAPPTIDLSLKELLPPEPTSLAIRRDAGLAAASIDPGEAVLDPLIPRSVIEREIAGPVRRLEEQVIFRVNLGFGLDGGNPRLVPCVGAEGLCPAQLLSGELLDEEVGYERLRMYSFGDAVLGSRGLLSPSLNTYLAAEYRLDQPLGRQSGPIPTIYDGIGDQVLIRSGYAEVEDFFERSALRPLYLRAGRMFKYGPAIAHFDGVTVGYDTPWVRVSVFGGSRVSLYGYGAALPDSGVIEGSDLRVDLYQLRRTPLVITASTIGFAGRRHAQGGLAFQYNPDILVGADLRLLDRRVARQTLTVRARISEVTTIYAELDNRGRGDWMYDLLLLEPRPGTDPGQPRRYLELGPPLPRAHLNLRAGTVLFDNVDVLLRAAAAIERSGEAELPSSFSPSYVEAGGAAELRVRRSLRLGSSATLRRYRRDLEMMVQDRPDLPDPLPPHTGAIGERSFSEGGLLIGYTAGARVFNAAIEGYARIYEPHTPYVVAEDFADLDVRSGGRFSVEGWAARRLRLKGEYDVTFNRLRFAPELRGVKSLRVLMEGTF